MYSRVLTLWLFLVNRPHIHACHKHTDTHAHSLTYPYTRTLVCLSNTRPVAHMHTYTHAHLNTGFMDRTLAQRKLRRRVALRAAFALLCRLSHPLPQKRSEGSETERALLTGASTHPTYQSIIRGRDGEGREGQEEGESRAGEQKKRISIRTPVVPGGGDGDVHNNRRGGERSHPPSSRTDREGAGNAHNKRRGGERSRSRSPSSRATHMDGRGESGPALGESDALVAGPKTNPQSRRGETDTTPARARGNGGGRESMAAFFVSDTNDGGEEETIIDWEAWRRGSSHMLSTLGYMERTVETELAYEVLARVHLVSADPPPPPLSLPPTRALVLPPRTPFTFFRRLFFSVSGFSVVYDCP